MKIVIVGPGIMSIPSVGWGAVEILIWDYKQVLENIGHEVFIVNTKNRNEIIDQTNKENPDFVHVQYDDFFDIVDKFTCKNVAITSHFGYLDQENKFSSNNYWNIFNGFKTINAKIFALSPGIKDVYVKNGFNENKLYVVPNGVRDDLFNYKEQGAEDKSIYLAKIEPRKRQFLFGEINNLYFAGNIVDQRFKSSNYLGEWNKEYLYENLTNFANLVLLSDGEAHPLVCLEAMAAGLGLVLSQYATANLDLSKPFIDVIPEDKINDIKYVENIITENRKKSLTMRSEIRKYVLDNFSWTHIIKTHYIPYI